MRFQAKWENYTLLVKKSYYQRFPDGEKQLVPGLRAKFVGPQRIFDSEGAQRQFGWSDEDRKKVEEFILKNDKFGRGIYLAPGEKLNDEQIAVASWVPPQFKPRCQHIEAVGTELIQCPNQSGAGRDFCADHDPKMPQITRGLSTT